MTIQEEILEMLPTGWTADIIDRTSENYDIKGMIGFDVIIKDNTGKVTGYYGVDEDNRQSAMLLIKNSFVLWP